MSSKETDRDKPNFLIIMSDEHGAQFSSSYGHEFISTPNMDRLSREGVTFDSAYCNAPLCVPSRICFMTGRYNSNCEGWDNAVPVAEDVVTWPYLLRSIGYDAVLAGKMHLVGLDNLRGFRAQLSRDIHSEMSHPIYGWDQGLPTATSPWKGLISTGTGVPGHEGPSDGLPEELRNRTDQPTGPGSTVEIAIDDATEKAAVEYLKAAGGRNQPFALCVGFIAPHFPFVVPDEYYSRYYPQHADLPVLPDDHLTSLPEAAQNLRKAFGFWGHTKDQIRKARAAYYGLVTYLDDKIGSLLRALDEANLTENTIVIHTSDHGEMLGEHGLWRKMCFYDQAARIPLQIRLPKNGLKGERIQENVSLIDVTATMLDAAGIPPSEQKHRWGIDGASLMDLMNGKTANWPDEAFSEHNAHGTEHPRAMLKRGPWKLCVTHGRPEATELYNTETDPGEFHNRAEDPQCGDILSAMRGRINEMWDGEGIEKRVVASQRRRLLIQSAVAEMK